MQTVKENFDFLEPQNLLRNSKQETLGKCENLCKKYSKVLSNSFINQFAMMYEVIKHDLTSKMTIRQFFELLINKYACMEVDFSEVYAAFLLFFILPVTVATLERSFSKLKILKNCMRSTTSEQRLRNLAILSIEYKSASALDLQDLINRFANAKVRKRPF